MTDITAQRESLGSMNKSSEAESVEQRRVIVAHFQRAAEFSLQPSDSR
ncbi:MAG: hypothetical protein HC846_05365 [Blastocatellia bacterium]|nr:hypothetical protein [Blastocatellia bacterium]